MGIDYGAVILYGFELVKQPDNEVELEQIESELYFKRKDLSVGVFSPDYYGYDNTHFVYVNESHHSTELGYPAEIDWKPENIAVWNRQLNIFCEEYNYVFGEPKWWIMAYMH